MSLGTTESRLVVLRGNSGSGKSTTARQLRARLGRGTAIVEQDQIRRVLLWEKDTPGNAAIDLIGLNARYCLDRGFDVIVEGILSADRYGDMLRGLTADHRGTTVHYYFDIPFEETLARHATRSWAANVAPESMREWYEARRPAGRGGAARVRRAPGPGRRTGPDPQGPRSAPGPAV